MKKLPLGKVSPGEVVARPVSTSNGVVLVQPGTALTPEMVRRLEGLGIESIWLEGAAADARTPEELLAELDDRFAGHEGSELMMALKALVRTRLVQGGY
jgi:hypothetical protein